MPIIYACVVPDGAVATRTGEAIATAAEELRAHGPDLAIVVQEGAGSRIELDDDRLFEATTAADVPVAMSSHEIAAPEPLELADVATATITTSRLALREHFELGRAIGRALAEDERRIAIVCVATLSHALDQLARGYDRAGRLFDDQYRRGLENWSVKWLVNLDASFRSSAREQAATQTAVLMGALSESRVQPRPLSYEVTSGVGHFVAVIDLLGARRSKPAAASGIAEKE